MKILIIEDEKDLLALYQLRLEEVGHEVKLCEDGLSGANCLLTEKFDLIICDIKMPHKEGQDVIRFYRKSSISSNVTPILVVSGFINSKLEIELKSMEKVHLLNKPFDWDDFVTKIENIASHHVVREPIKA